MRRPVIYIAFLLSCFIYSKVNAQDIIKQVPCTNQLIQHQADSIKADMVSKGFIVVKENSITMESGYEMPIIVPLKSGAWYQFVFIGDITSRLYEVRMYDWNEKQVMYEKNTGSQGNIISYLFVPVSTEYYMIKPLQVNKNKKKDLCGYVMLLKKVK